MTTLVFLLEELSIQTMLELILPRILPYDVQFQCIAFRGKQELRKLTDKYEPILGARAIAPHLRLDGSNASISFHHLISGIQRIASQNPASLSQTGPVR